MRCWQPLYTFIHIRVRFIKDLLGVLASPSSSDSFFSMSPTFQALAYNKDMAPAMYIIPVTISMVLGDTNAM